MLVEFTVENFKSFPERTTLSLVAAPLRSENPALDAANVVRVSDDLSLLRSAAIYGANASGKSNLGAALRAMRRCVLESSREMQASDPIPVEPFLLSTETREQPSLFEVIFLLDGRQYRYGFQADRRQVVSEWLFMSRTKRETTLFTREGQQIFPKAAFREGKGLEERTRANALFLSVAAQFNGEVSQMIQNWFKEFAVTTGLRDDEFFIVTLANLRDPKVRADTIALIKELDLDLEDVTLAEPPAPRDLSANLPESIKVIAMSDALAGRIRTVHLVRNPQGEVIDTQAFYLDTQESQGTRKLIALAGPLLSVLTHGTILFVDELDARLHPLITRRLIELFHSPQTNPRGAQLIFATHDTNLLDKVLFRRDQVWFTEKDRRGASHLISLAEYRVRSDAAYEKQYLEGRYGAIPFLGDLTRLPSGGGETARREAGDAGAPAEAAHG